ncbi:hypothetical protein H0H81_005324 [Sphagnurus paluster]|uniref:C4-dicarboxylate transporter/malic acid transport protein n=1 Tax=Sphagnurus paluster TaxID=117069 RepID=A0A9P7GSW2_9AGAR|nr:hypothetical protein H0H81_005324 [Sphagnurus paluster]
MQPSGTDIGKVTFQDIIRNFSPTWFAATMGTGAISILFSAFPYGHATAPMRALSLTFFFLNLLLFMLFTALSITRYARYPQSWTTMLYHPSLSLYTGCFPMGATTLINVSVDVINVEYAFGGANLFGQYGGRTSRYRYCAVGAWCTLCTLVDFFRRTKRTYSFASRSTTHRHTLHAMTAAWLLPVVTLTVAASSGGVLARALQPHSHSYALTTVVVSTFLVIIGLTLALMLITIYFLRLILHGLPPREKILSVFLPLGPSAQSAFAILLIGQNFRTLLPLPDGTSASLVLLAKNTGETIHVVCVAAAFLLWALAVMCIVFALLGIYSTVRVRRQRFPFILPFWGLVFPNGVFANLTLNLAAAFDSPFFRILGSVYAVATLLVWTFVASRTLSMVYDRTIFAAPPDDINDQASLEVNQKLDALGHESLEQSASPSSSSSATASICVARP